MDLYERMDTDTPQWEGFLAAWNDTIGDKPTTVAELIKEIGQFEDLSAALPDSLATRDSRDYSRRLGNALAKRNEVRLPNGLMLSKAGSKKHAMAWQVVSYGNGENQLTHPVLDSEVSHGELVSYPTRRESENTDSYIEGPGTDSPNSPSGSNSGELGLPDVPDEPCPNCGTENSWGMKEDLSGYYCVECAYGSDDK
jgi:hypothetical protein